MCISKLSQLIYGALAVCIVGLTVASLFTPGWRKIQAEVEEGADKATLVNETISMGLFPFACGWELGKSELHLNTSAMSDVCQKWWENQPTYEKVVIVIMCLALLASVAALAWNVLTFFCCIGRGGVFRPLPSLAALSAICLLVALLIYYFNNEKDIEILKAWDNIKSIADTDVGYSFFLALGALLLSVANCVVGSFVVQTAERCI